MFRRREAATRAILNLKLRLRASRILIKRTARDHFLMAADFRGWAETETDPKKKARLISLGTLAEGLGRSARRCEVEARAKAKRPARKRRPRS